MRAKFGCRGRCGLKGAPTHAVAPHATPGGAGSPNEFSSKTQAVLCPSIGSRVRDPIWGESAPLHGSVDRGQGACRHARPGLRGMRQRRSAAARRIGVSVDAALPTFRVSLNGRPRLRCGATTGTSAQTLPRRRADVPGAPSGQLARAASRAQALTVRRERSGFTCACPSSRARVAARRPECRAWAGWGQGCAAWFPLPAEGLPAWSGVAVLLGG